MSPEAIEMSMEIDQNSIASTKRYGDRGSPFLMPLLLSNFPVGEPLNMTKKEAIDIHSLIQLVHLDEKPMQ